MRIRSPTNEQLGLPPLRCSGCNRPSWRTYCGTCSEAIDPARPYAANDRLWNGFPLWPWRGRRRGARAGREWLT